jgi:hypothetical protein
MLLRVHSIPGESGEIAQVTSGRWWSGWKGRMKQLTTEFRHFGRWCSRSPPPEPACYIFASRPTGQKWAKTLLRDPYFGRFGLRQEWAEMISEWRPELCIDFFINHICWPNYSREKKTRLQIVKKVIKHD